MNTTFRRAILGAFCIGIVLGSAQGAQKALPSVQLEPVMVGAYKMVPFRASGSGAAVGSQSPQEELPVVIDSLTQEIIQAKNNATVLEVLQMQSGVFSDGQSFLSRTPGMYTLRGRAGSELTLDGLVLPSGMGLVLDSSSLDRIDIVKGPVGGREGGQLSSLGAYGVGGSVHLALKEPEFIDKVEAGESVRMGSGFRSRSTWDVNQVNETGDVGVRVSGGATFEQPFWAASSARMGEVYSVAPVVTWKLNENLSLSVKSSFQSLDMPGYQGIPVLGGVRVGVYDSSFGGDISRDHYQGGILQVILEKKEEGGSSLKIGMGVGQTRLDWTHFYASTNTRGMQGYLNLIEKGEGVYGYGWNDTTNTTYSLFAQKNKVFFVGELKQEVGLRLEFSQKRSTGYSYFGNTTQVLQVGVTQPESVPRVRNASSSAFSDLYKTGLSLQDELSWESWRILLGSRADYCVSNEQNESTTLSPHAGVSYLWNSQWVSFANMAQTTAPNFGYLGEGGEELTNRWKATQYEAGVRYSPLKDFWVSSSFFYIDQRGTPELMANTTNRYVSGGHSLSKGVELSATGALSAEWSMFLSYSWQWYKDVSAHQRFDRFPANTLSLWQLYTPAEGFLEGVTFGLGYRYSGSYFITERGNKLAENYTLPSYSLFDATVEVPLPECPYYQKAFFKVGVYNILNKEYYPSSRGPTQCFAGSPRTLELSLRCEF